MPVKKKKAEPQYTIIKQSDVLNGLKEALAQFEFNKRQKKYVLTGSQKKIDGALALADKYEQIAGKLQPGSAKHREALRKLIEQA